MPLTCIVFFLLILQISFLFLDFYIMVSNLFDSQNLFVEKFDYLTQGVLNFFNAMTLFVQFCCFIIEFSFISAPPHNRRRRPRRRRLRGIQSRSDTNRTGAEGLSFYYPRLLHCLDQVLAVVVLSQHRVSSFKIVTPRALCGARCIEHAVSTWSAVCSEAPYSQFDEGAIPYWAIPFVYSMDEWNRPTSIRRRLSLTQAARDKPIQTGLAPVPDTKARSLKATSQYSVFHL